MRLYLTTGIAMILWGIVLVVIAVSELRRKEVPWAEGRKPHYIILTTACFLFGIAFLIIWWTEVLQARGVLS